MIIVISNRNLTEEILTEPKKYKASVLGQVPNDTDENIVGIHTRKGKKNYIEIYPGSHAKSLFENIKKEINQGNEEYSRPWVFFVHGNNQSIDKNLKKSRLLSSSHGVNVIAFSWPSQPLGSAIERTGLAKNILINTLKGTLGKMLSPEKLFIESGKVLKSYYDNYMEARKNANASVNSLYRALEFAASNLYNHIPQSDRQLLIHSLGHKVLRDLITINDKLPLSSEKIFSSIILHQPDEEAANHEVWVSRLKPYTKRLYLTQNVHDGVLWTSSIANKNERLGQSTNREEASKAVYINFTYGYNINEKHNMFNMNKIDSDDNEYVAKFFDRVLNGFSDALPYTGEDIPVNKGFARLSSSPPMFSLVELYDIFEDHETVDIRDERHLIDSM